MKINFLLFVFVLFVLWQAGTASVLDPNNPPAARTGAPGETTCAASGCHSGGTYTGSVSIAGLPDTVLANTSYSVTLTQTSNAVRAGFELTCLDASNARCGSLIAGTGCSIGSSGGRQYARQSSPKTLSNGSASWTFTWKSPASASGNAATLYFVSLAANGNGKNSGDNVLSATKSVVVQQLVATHDLPEQSSVHLYPSMPQAVLHIDLTNQTSGRITIFNLEGKSVLSGDLGQQNQLNISHLQKGVYVAEIRLDGRTEVKRFIVN